MARYGGSFDQWFQGSGRKQDGDFSGVDYYEWLKANAPEDGGTGNKRWGDPDVTDLVWARGEVLNWLRDNQDYLWEAGDGSYSNKPGHAGGLFHRINNNSIQSEWKPDRDVTPDKFDQSDYLAALATGRSSWEVRNWLGQHLHIPNARNMFDALTSNREHNIRELYKEYYGEEYDDQYVQYHIDSGFSLNDVRARVQVEYNHDQEQAAAQEEQANATPPPATTLTDATTSGSGIPSEDRANWDDASKAFVKQGSHLQFGTSDYHHFLRQVRDRNLTTEHYSQLELNSLAELGITNDGNLENARIGITEWMGDNLDKQQRNSEGDYIVKDWIEDTATIRTDWGDYANETDAGNLFSEADFLAARAAGHTRFTIYNWMKDNEQTWKNKAGGTEAWNENRDALITRGTMSNASTLHRLQNPHIQEVADYIRANQIDIKNFNEDIDAQWGGHDGHWSRNDAWWHTQAGALDAVKEFLRDGPKNNRWSDRPDWYTTNEPDYGISSGDGFDSNWGALVGQIPGQSSIPTAYQAGEYWQQWGAIGPRTGDADANDDPSLGPIQSSYAGAFTGDPRYMDEDEAEERLDQLEERFLKIMYEDHQHWDTDADTPPQYETAPDEWGLDIARMVRDDDGDITYNGHKYSALTHGHEHFDSSNDFEESNRAANEWFETLYKGQINWAFYEEDDNYEAARVALGMDDKIDTVSEIRLANVWVHGQKSDVISSEDAPEWRPYVARFDPDTEPPWEKRELSVGDYTTPAKDRLAPSPAGPGNIEVNVAQVDIKKPDNLPATWSIIDD